MPKYFKIPQCPRCKSWKTGRYVKKFTDLSDREILNYLKKGERVRPSLDYFVDNLTHMYCEECNAKWEGYVQPVNLSYEEIEKEKEIRAISTGDIFNIKHFKTKKKLKRKIQKLKSKIHNIKNNLK